MTRLVSAFVPGLEINKRFVENTATEIHDLSAYIFGAAAQVVRHSEDNEKELGYVGQYDETGTLIDGDFNTSYAWPNRTLGGTIDEDFVKVHIDQALLKYAELTDSNTTIEGRNTLVHATKNFASNPSNPAYPASVDFGDREVQIGDRVRVEGVDASANPYTHTSYVRDIIANQAAAVVNPAEGASSNQAAVVAATNTVADGAFNSTNTLAAIGGASDYNGLASGFVAETYTVEVIQASTADFTTGRLKVTSASGTDDQAIVVPGADGIAFAIGTRGLEIVLSDNTGGGSPGLVVGDVWTVDVEQAYTPPTVNVTGTFSAPDKRSRKYIVEILKGGEFDATDMIMRVSETSGLDTSRTFVLDVDVTPSTLPEAVGSFGLTVSLDLSEGLVTGDKWTIEAIPESDAEFRTLVLAHHIPDTINRSDTAAVTSVSLYIVDDIEIPHRSDVPGQYNFTVKDDELLLRGGITYTHPEWTVGGSSAPLTLASPVTGATAYGRVYVTYRAWLPQSSGLASMTSVSDELDEALEGPVDHTNPLKLALSKAGLVSAGNTIYYFNVGDPSVHDNWMAALAAADDTAVTYGLVPLTRDPAVLDAVASHVDTRSGPLSNLYRVAWLTGDDVEESIVLNDNLTDDNLQPMATITDDPNTSGTQYNLLSLTSNNFGFVTAAVRPGDRVRYAFATDVWGDESYDEYVVERVLDETTLLLRGGSQFAETVSRKMEIHRTLTSEERVDAFKQVIEPYTLPAGGSTSIANVGAKYSGHLFRMLFFGTVYDGTQELPSYYQAAVLASARGALAPHQGMTRMVVPGFTGVKGVNRFSREQLNEVAAAGGFIVSPDVSTGQLLVRHAVTAGDWSNVNTREESVISNVDSISFYFFSLLDPYIGKANAVDETFAKIKNDLIAGRNFLQAANTIDGLGGQLIDMEITKLRQSPLAADTLLIEMELDVPGPLNRIRTTMYIV